MDSAHLPPELQADLRRGAACENKSRAARVDFKLGL